MKTEFKVGQIICMQDVITARERIDPHGLLSMVDVLAAHPDVWFNSEEDLVHIISLQDLFMILEIFVYRYETYCKAILLGDEKIIYPLLKRWSLSR